MPIRINREPFAKTDTGRNRRVERKAVIAAKRAFIAGF